MAVTITYLHPTQAAPSAGQAGNMVVATVIASAAADTSAIITHAMNLSNAQITQGFPQVTLVPQADGATSPWFEASQNPNYTVLEKSTDAAGALTKVFIARPHSITKSRNLY